MTVPDAAAGQGCRVCGAPATRGWPDGWYCDARACIDQRTWGRSLDPDQPKPPGSYCAPGPGRCYCGRCPHYVLPPPAHMPEWARATLTGKAPEPAAGAAAARVEARVMAAAARARSRGAMAPPSEAPDPITEPRAQLRHDAPDTSAAAAAAVLPRTGTKRRQVLEAIVEAHQRGHLGATDPELQRHLGMPPNTQRPRRVELASADPALVYDSGRRRAHAGHEHIVWAPTRAALQLLGAALVPA